MPPGDTVGRIERRPSPEATEGTARHQKDRKWLPATEDAGQPAGTMAMAPGAPEGTGLMETGVPPHAMLGVHGRPRGGGKAE